MLSVSFISNLEGILSAEFEQAVRIFQNKSVGGGCINHAHKLETSVGNLFLKYNSKSRFPGMFEAEAKGLKLLRQTKTIHVPEFILIGEHQAFSFIVLEFLETASRQKNYWESAGMQLANLHRNTSDKFGLDHDNFIGSLPQSNTMHEDWLTFFLQERLLAVGAEIISPYCDKLEHALMERLPKETPALLHGDLWNGNIMIGSDGYANFFDPAVYYGHREIDLAMTKLFGGFPPEFYKAYDSEFPLQRDFDERVDLYNLYPLLVHVKLFGGSYLDQVKSILNML